ncbi:MAG: nucleotide-diphospho-sugar transferase [Elusimicrobiota bacterium]
MKIPILFIVFNRSDTTQRVFEEIKKARPLRLYIASDGPREDKKGEAKIVEKIREYLLKNIDWNCEVKTFFENKNWGPMKYVSMAITWFFENEEMGIILEHDCVPSQSFFKFCEELLVYYKDDDKVGMIFGFNPFSNRIKIDSSFFFSKYDIIWGWATWRRVWKLYDVEIKSWIEDKKSGVLNSFSDNYLVRKYFQLIFDLYYYKVEKSSWDAQFSYVLMKHNMLTIVPQKNLIKNIGYGSEDAVHTIDKAPSYIENAELEELRFPIVYPSNYIIYNRWERLIEKVHHKITFFKIVKLYLKLILGKYDLFFIYKFFRGIYRKVKKFLSFK